MASPREINSVHEHLTANLGGHHDAACTQNMARSNLWTRMNEWGASLGLLSLWYKYFCRLKGQNTQKSELRTCSEPNRTTSAEPDSIEKKLVDNNRYKRVTSV